MPGFWCYGFACPLWEKYYVISFLKLGWVFVLPAKQSPGSQDQYVGMHAAYERLADYHYWYGKLTNFYFIYCFRISYMYIII